MPAIDMQQDRHHGRDHRALACQPGPLRQVGRLAVGVAHDHQQAERGERREAVGEHVEQHAGDAVLGQRDARRPG